MKIDKVRQAILKVSSGKCVCPETTLNPTSYQLVLKNLQKKNTHITEVKVYDILHNETSKCMAFGFKLNDEDIFPFVTDGTELKYMRLPSTQKITEDTFNETFLFKWGKSACNNWRSLKSVAQPNLYLFVEENVKLTINSVEMPEFKIERVLKRSRNVNEPQKNVRTPRINQDSNQTLDSTKFWLRKRKTKKIKMSLKNKWSDSFEVL